MKNKFEIFLDTDIFLYHLEGKSSKNKPLLSKCVRLFDGCYTSVVNASEIFSECENPKMLEEAKNLFKDVGILGIPFRYSLKIGEVIKSIKKKNPETLYGML